MSSTPPRKGRLRLVRQLSAAYESLASCETSLRQAALASARGLSMPSDARALLAMVEKAMKALTVRLQELGAEPPSSNSLSPFEPRPAGAPPLDEGQAPSGIYVRACEACGRALGVAYQEAQAVSDLASVRTVYGSLREFEKQLWVLDPGHAV